MGLQHVADCVAGRITCAAVGTDRRPPLPVPLLSWCCCAVCVSVSHSASSFSEAMRMGAEVYHNLKNLIKDKYGECGGSLVLWGGEDRATAGATPPLCAAVQ